MRTAFGKVGPLLATLAALLLGSGALALLAAGPAGAAPAKAGSMILAAPSVSVIDNADVLTSAEQDRITAAARRLSEPDQVVVVTARVGTGDLVNYLHDLGSQVGWDGDQFGAGTLVLAVGTDIRQMDMYYGSDLAGALDPRNDPIFAAMGPYFKQGDWGGGLTAGLGAVGQAFAGTLPSTETGTDYEGKPDPSHTGWIVFGGLGVGAVGCAGGKSLLRKRKETRAKQAEERRKDELTAANSVAAGDLRARLDQDQLLVNSIEDGPLQDQLEQDLMQAQSDLRSAQGESDPDAGKKDIDAVTDAIGSIDRRISLLRQASDWQVAWSQEVESVREDADRLRKVVAEIAAFPATAPAAPDLTAQLTTLETEVREQRTPIAAGLGSLMTISRDVRTRLQQADDQLESLEQARRIAERKRQEEARQQAEAEAQRQREQEQTSYYNRRGGNGSAWIGGWIAGSILSGGRRGGGGGWGGGGGGWGGGGGFGGGRSGGSGSSWSRGGGGGFSRGGGGGSGSRGF